MKPLTTINIKFANGAVWSLPAKVVAENRAAYYAEIDAETTFEKEVKSALEDDSYLLTDWAANNMHWADLQPHATLISPPPEFVYDEWTFSDAEINVE